MTLIKFSDYIFSLKSNRSKFIYYIIKYLQDKDDRTESQDIDLFRCKEILFQHDEETMDIYIEKYEEDDSFLLWLVMYCD